MISPQFHGIHILFEETAQEHNLGVLFPWWDRCFGTFWRAGGGQDREVGVKEISPEQPVELTNILAHRSPLPGAVESGRERLVAYPMPIPRRLAWAWQAWPSVLLLKDPLSFPMPRGSPSRRRQPTTMESGNATLSENNRLPRQHNRHLELRAARS